MMVMIAGALICALTLAIILHPLMLEKKTRTLAKAFGFIIVVGSLSFYLWQGNPEMPAASASYEKDEQRAAIRSLMSQLRFQPNNPDLLTSLGQIYFEAGDLERSIVLLEKALVADPKHLRARNGLGAMLFGIGMMMRSQGASDAQILPVWRQAFDIAPEGAPYRETIKRNLDSLDLEDDNGGE